MKTTVKLCTERLLQFHQKLDDLTSFFTHLHDLVQGLDEGEVENFASQAAKAKEMGNRAKGETVSASRAEYWLKKKEDKLNVRAKKTPQCPPSFPQEADIP